MLSQLQCGSCHEMVDDTYYARGQEMCLGCATWDAWEVLNDLHNQGTIFAHDKALAQDAIAAIERYLLASRELYNRSFGKFNAN